MDAKDVKSRLKDAREAIRKKEFDVALKHAEEVLNSDKSNYNALVFVGAAAQELNDIEKAEKSFKKAVSVQPNQLLAWQGWCALCEKSTNPSHKSELLIIYEKLVALQSDADKKFELTSKLAQLYLERKEFDKTLKVLQSQYTIVSDDSAKKSQVDQAIVKVLSSENKICEENENLMKSTLKNIFSSDNEFDIEARKLYLTEYIKLLLKENDAELCLKKSQKLIDLDPELIYPHRVICTLYLNAVAREKNLEITNIGHVVEKLLSLDSTNRVAKIAEIALKYSSDEKEALMILLGSLYIIIIITNLSIKSEIESGESVDECLILMRSSQLIHQYEKSINFASVGLECCKTSSIGNTSRVFKALQLGLINAQLNVTLDENNEILNISTLENLLSIFKSDIETCQLLIRYYLKREHFEAAKKLCCDDSQWEGDSDLMDCYLGAVLRRQNEETKARTKLEFVMNKFPNDSFLMMELALIYRQLDNYPNSLLCLLTVEKCQRCYKKSFAINPNDKHVAMALSDLYAQMGMEKENVELLTTVTSNDNKWALIRLGYCHYKEENLSAAIKSLQKALSIDNKDSHCWEYLADCYMKRGSYTAALKSYTRALELNPDSIYCYYQMAEIRQLLQDYENAANEYRVILNMDPTYIPALKGYGVVKLLEANYYFDECLPGLAKDCNAKAIEIFSNHLSICQFVNLSICQFVNLSIDVNLSFTRAVLLQPNLSCLWKLLGDACTLTRRIPPESCQFEIDQEFVTKANVGNKTLRKEQLLDLGTRCYRQALSLHQSDELWHDIAMNYHYQAMYATDVNEKQKLFNHSLLAIKKALALNPQHFAHWSALGIVAVSKLPTKFSMANVSTHSWLKNFALAQHAFIKSIKVEENNPDAWTNLGLIYLLHDNVELAHKAFSTAQTLDPSHIKCWIGMAMIAEKIGHLEAMDLFRHTTSLGYHGQSALGYAHWVAQVLLDEKIDKRVKVKFWQENMASLPTPSDCLVKYTGNVTDDPQAFNTLGIFLEREKLFSLACQAFERAIGLLEKTKTKDVARLDFVRSNYARVLCSRGKYKSSAEQFLLVKNPDFNSQCGLALAFYKSQCNEESIQAYEAAIHWFAKTDSEKSDVFVAMAAVAYRMNNVEAAKQLLFQSFELRPPSVYGIFSLCAIGLLLDDSNLIDAATTEMLPYLKNHLHSATAVKLVCFTKITQGKNKEAQRIISKAIHEFPAHDQLWFILSRTLLQFSNEKSHVIDRCLSTLLEKSNFSITQVFGFRNIVHLANGYVSDCIKSAQKMLILNPSETANWAGLVASLVMRDGLYATSANREWFLKILNHTTKQACSSGNNGLHEWLRWYQSLMALNANCDQVKNRSSQTSTTDAILEWLKNNNGSKNPKIDALRQHVELDPKFSFGWHVLVKSCAVAGKHSEALEILESWIRSGSKSQNVPLTILYNLALEQYQKHRQKEWLKSAEKIESEMKSCEGENNDICFLLAKKHFLKKEQKKMTGKLQQIASATSQRTGYGWTEKAAKIILETNVVN
uniref:Tetratricopeptide repeat protein 37 n=1 Tax=Strigamia maritima TaxID=126957 RepID=T1IWR9_STRMM